MRILNGETGEELTRVPLPNVYRLKRSAFRGFLVAGLNVQVEQPIETIRGHCTYLYCML